MPVSVLFDSSPRATPTEFLLHSLFQGDDIRDHGINIVNRLPVKSLTFSSHYEQRRHIHCKMLGSNSRTNRVTKLLLPAQAACKHYFELKQYVFFFNGFLSGAKKKTYLRSTIKIAAGMQVAIMQKINFLMTGGSATFCGQRFESLVC